MRTQRFLIPFSISIITIFIAKFCLAGDVTPPEPGTLEEFLNNVFQAIHDAGGLGWSTKIAVFIFMIIASAKTTFFAPIWNRLGPSKILLIPLLSLLAGAINLTASKTFSWAALMSWVWVGSGSIAVHEFFTALIKMPLIGPAYLSTVNTAYKILTGGAIPPEVRQALSLVAIEQGAMAIHQEHHEHTVTETIETLPTGLA